MKIRDNSSVYKYRITVLHIFPAIADISLAGNFSLLLVQTLYKFTPIIKEAGFSWGQSRPQNFEGREWIKKCLLWVHVGEISINPGLGEATIIVLKKVSSREFVTEINNSGEEWNWLLIQRVLREWRWLHTVNKTERVLAMKVWAGSNNATPPYICHSNSDILGIVWQRFVCEIRAAEWRIINHHFYDSFKEFADDT